MSAKHDSQGPVIIFECSHCGEENEVALGSSGGDWEEAEATDPDGNDDGGEEE